MEVNKENSEESKPTGLYKVENVILLESSFSRKTEVSLDNRVIANEINISSEAHEASPEKKFGVTLTLAYAGKQDELIVCVSQIKMLGIFEKVGEPALPEDSFKKINAPAIIYPFVREHLHNICLKAGIVNVLLPTVNFKI